MTLAVIGAGFGRTGTLSLKIALEELGFGPCYHMEEVIKRPSRTKRWANIAGGQAPNWRQVFKGFRATVDWPGCTYYRELMPMYPTAKVILTVRDPDRWYDSTYETIYQASQMPGHVRFIPPLAQYTQMTLDLIWEGTFHGRFPDRDYAIQIFNRHNETVQQFVPPDRLLVFKVKEGWEPLCHFLGAPVPDKSFPHANNRPQMIRRIRAARLLAQWGPPFTLAGFFLAVYLVYRWSCPK